MSAFGQYIKDTKMELKHVAWPTQMQTIVYTALVVGISIAVALYIGFFDFFFTRGLEEFLRTDGASSVVPSTAIDTEGLDFNVIPGAGNDMPAITNEPSGGPAPEVN